ncbi:MAG: PH domain-containing protein [Candidatus Nanohalobium sp.]
MRGLERRTLILWILQVTAVVAIIGLGLVAAAASKIIPVFYLALIPIFEAVGIVYMFFRYRNWRFELRDDHLFLDHGVLKRTRSMVPYVRVQHIDTQRGPVQRVLGLSKVVVYTAGSKGADVTVPGLSRQDASEVQEKLRDLAIESEDMDAV